jgi:hypothetical protein
MGYAAPGCGYEVSDLFPRIRILFPCGKSDTPLPDVDTGGWIRIRGVGCGYGDSDLFPRIHFLFPCGKSDTPCSDADTGGWIRIRGFGFVSPYPSLMSTFALRHFERSEAQSRNPLQRPTCIKYPVSVFESPRPPLMPMHTLLYGVFFFVFPAGNKIRHARMRIRGIGYGYGDSDLFPRIRILFPCGKQDTPRSDIGSCIRIRP